MSLIDERGRLFGKINIIDLSVAVVVLVLIPVAYGAYVLFRAKPPRVTAIEPSTVTQGKDERIILRGENLRPFLTVVIGRNTGTFLLQSPSVAEVKLPPLTPGVYDVFVYDVVQLIEQLPGAVTVLPPAPLARAGELVVRFIATPDVADRLKVGDIDNRPVTGEQFEPATITAVKRVGDVAGEMLFSDASGATLRLNQAVASIVATLSVPAHNTPTGWQYKGQILKTGLLMPFETDVYNLRGFILGWTPPEPDGDTAPTR